jgi:hypothetical protein
VPLLVLSAAELVLRLTASDVTRRRNAMFRGKALPVVSQSKADREAFTSIRAGLYLDVAVCRRWRALSVDVVAPGPQFDFTDRHHFADWDREEKNGIMMIDFVAEREEGLAPEKSIYQECLLRFRPIMMTTMAALLGAPPLAVGTGAE